MARTVTFKGNPLTIVGRNIGPGMPAPDFRATSQDMKAVGLADFKGKIKVVASFPSLDTPVCDLQVKEFNKRASSLSKDVAVIGISKDLPFAQARFCSAHDIKNETVLSDYKSSSFGINYGLVIKELNLLARSVWIIDKDDTVRYFQLAPEITTALNYDDAMNALNDVITNPSTGGKKTQPKCKPCEVGGSSLPKAEIDKLMGGTSGWELVDDKKIVKEFKFKDFQGAKHLLDTISVIAEEQGHHPTLTLIYNKLKVTFTTHSVGGLTENDFIMARIVDDIARDMR